MSNQTISGLNSITAPSTGALLWVSDPDASPQDRSLSLSALLAHYTSAYIRTLLDDADAAAARATLLTPPHVGYMNLSFSTLGTGKPDLLGSVEVNGTLVTFAATTPTGSPASPSSNWIYVSDAGAVSFDAANDPAWDTDKGGYYYGDLRAVAWLRVDSSGYYRYHHFLPLEQKANIDFEETIDIGDWNMDTTPELVIFPKLDPTKIIGINVVIRGDEVGTTVYCIGGYIITTTIYGSSGSLGWFITRAHPDYLYLTRAGGIFDSANFNQTSFNRGWVHIKHREL